MPTQVHSASLYGIDGYLLQVEVDLLSLLPTFLIVGLPHSSVRESRERVRSAIRSSDLPFPRRRITVNLAPADRPKQGTGLDLPIALGVVAAAWDASHERPAWDRPPFALGELGLSGQVRPVRGVLPLVEAARNRGVRRVIVPAQNSAEAALVPGVEVLGVGSLKEAWGVARGGPARATTSAPTAGSQTQGDVDLADVRGLPWGRRVLEVAAAGGHGLLLEGPPGSGKSMLAKRLPSILPTLPEERALEVTRIRSACGLLDWREGLVRRPPLRAPHHTASLAAVIGGGHPIRPGEVTLAHRGVLLLDEVPEFPRSILEGLRQPLQDGRVVVARRDQVLHLPCAFQLVATRNPCPCGRAGRNDGSCSCSQTLRENYSRRVSGPLLDRIDMVAWIDPVPAATLLDSVPGESSETVRERVTHAHGRRGSRSSKTTRGGLGDLTLFSDAGRNELTRLVRLTRCSSRAVQQLISVAVTVHDLDGSEVLSPNHLEEAFLLCNPGRGTKPTSDPSALPHPTPPLERTHP